ncbi:hypothetical protein D478_04531 [Brevibacillus agri BAB-2500]|nr:hypothetical protein D478_04531 [Brevibacillus agri BAB-2500]
MGLLKASLLGKASLLAKSSRKKEFFTAKTYGCVSFCVKEDKRESRHQNGGNPKEAFFMTTLFVLSAAFLLAAVSLLHVYWAVGGSWGALSPFLYPRTVPAPCFAREKRERSQ